VTEAATGDVWYVRGEGEATETAWELPKDDNAVVREMAV
jgi:hypothetical protein